MLLSCEFRTTAAARLHWDAINKTITGHFHFRCCVVLSCGSPLLELSRRSVKPFGSAPRTSYSTIRFIRYTTVSEHTVSAVGQSKLASGWTIYMSESFEQLMGPINRPIRHLPNGNLEFRFRTKFVQARPNRSSESDSKKCSDCVQNRLMVS